VARTITFRLPNNTDGSNVAIEVTAGWADAFTTNAPAAITTAVGGLTATATSNRVGAANEVVATTPVEVTVTLGGTFDIPGTYSVRILHGAGPTVVTTQTFVVSEAGGFPEFAVGTAASTVPTIIRSFNMPAANITDLRIEINAPPVIEITGFAGSGGAALVDGALTIAATDTGTTVFIVETAALPAGFTATYQWQTRANSSAAWADVASGQGTGETTVSLTMAGALTDADSGIQYRVIVWANAHGTTENRPAQMISDVITVTITP
jgi:hypothetical protein